MYCKDCGNEMGESHLFCTKCGSKNSNKKDDKEVRKELKGIGGWLYFVAIGLVVTPLLYILGIIENADLYNELGAFDRQTANTLEAFLGAEIFANLFLLVLVAVVIYLFTKQSKKFKYAFAVWSILGTSILILDTIIATELFEFSSEELAEFNVEIVKSLVGTCIWVPYIFTSKRVKNTFIN